MKFLTTSTLALLLAAPMAFAQATDDTDQGGMEDDTMETTDDTGSGMDDDTSEMAEYDLADPSSLIRTRDITGGAVYTSDPADDEGWDANLQYDSVDTNWNQIGEIEDIVLDRNGQMIGIVAEIGGFLDIGDRHVVIEVDDLNLVAVDDRSYSYVTRYSEEELENLPNVDEGFWE
ncbi:MAG: PRC-barrel domain-containing protein [Roseicyclus sp.]